MVEERGSRWRQGALIAMASIAGVVAAKKHLKNPEAPQSPPVGNNFYVSPLPDPVDTREAEVSELEEVISEAPEVQIEQERINYKTTDFSEDSDSVLLARAAYGEARELCSPLIHKNSPTPEEIRFAEEGLAAVMYIAINRRDHERIDWGEDIREVILDPSYSRSYDVFMEKNPTRSALMDPQNDDPKAWDICLDVAERVISGEIKDPTNGATHFFSGSDMPYWADDMEPRGNFGNQKFYREN